MSKILVYASPSSQIYPLIPSLQKLSEEGRDILIKASCGSIRMLNEAGLAVTPISDSVEFFSADDWKCETYEDSLKLLIEASVQRSIYEYKDMSDALKAYQPSLIIADSTCLGVCTAAIESHIPMLTWASDLVPFPAQGIPPFGPGIPFSKSTFNALINWTKSSSSLKNYSHSIDNFNDFLAAHGIMPLRDFQSWFSSLPNLIYFTCEPIEYPRQWPSNVTLAGPGYWEPDSWDKEDINLEEDSREIILISLGSTYQNNEFLLQNAAAAFPSTQYQVIATTCSVNPKSFDNTYGIKISRFCRHSKILKRAACTVCSGGIGLIQKSLRFGVPVCVIPQIRSQFESAQRVVSLDAGTSLEAKKLTPSNLISSVRKAVGKKKKAEEIQQIINSIDTDSLCLNAIHAVMAEAGLISGQ